MSCSPDNHFPKGFLLKQTQRLENSQKLADRLQAAYPQEYMMVLSNLRKCPNELKWCFGTNQSKPPFSEMWALLVLTFAVAVGASEKVKNQTASEEKLVIARGKLLVSTGVKQEGKNVFYQGDKMTHWQPSLQAPSVVGWGIKKMPELHHFLMERWAL